MRTRTVLTTVMVAMMLSSSVIGLGRLMLEAKPQPLGNAPFAVSFADMPLDEAREIDVVR